MWKMLYKYNYSVKAENPLSLTAACSHQYTFHPLPTPTSCTHYFLVLCAE